MQVLFNNVNIATLGVFVTKITGIFDMPSRLGKTSYDWNDIDGINAFVNDNDIYFSQRTIKVFCEMNASNNYSFVINIGELRELIYNTKANIITPYGTYECILKKGAKVEPRGGWFADVTNVSFVLEFNQINFEFTGSKPVQNFDILDNHFWIDYVYFKDMGILVENSEGIFDFTEMKKDNLTKYRRESTNVNNRGARKIKLSCSLFASDLLDFNTKINNFQKLLSEPGTKKLMIPLEGVLKPFEVYNVSGFKLKAIYENENEIVGRFDIEFIEPNPVIEHVELFVLLDTTGTPILTTDGLYIYVIGTNLKEKTYLYTDSEQKSVYLYTDEELTEGDPDYDPNAKEVFLFTKGETE